MKLQLNNQTVTLLPEKAMYLDEYGILLVADTHFGKSGTFRQAGVAAPMASNTDGIARLDKLIKRLMPKRCIILGDFFHSRMNRSWDEVARWTLRQRNPVIELVKGNHDILADSDYAHAGIILHIECLDVGGFRLIHDADTQPNILSNLNGLPSSDSRAIHHAYSIASTMFTISGHIHPGIRMKGYAKQSLMLPCFHITQNGCLLPAFGSFTGLAEVQANPASRIFIPVPQDDIVLEIGNNTR